MERAELLEDLKSMMAEYMNDEGKLKLAGITDDTDFRDDLNMDSLDMVDIVIKAEQKYGIQIKNETIARLNTVGKCLNVMQERLAEKEQA